MHEDNLIKLGLSLAMKSFERSILNNQKSWDGNTVFLSKHCLNELESWKSWPTKAAECYEYGVHLIKF